MRRATQKSGLCGEVAVSGGLTVNGCQHDFTLHVKGDVCI